MAAEPVSPVRTRVTESSGATQTLPSPMVPEPADLTITLYKSKDKTSWSKVDSWSVSGPSLLTLNDGCFVMSGYYYFAKLTANVYDTSGNFIEDVSLSTNIESY